MVFPDVLANIALRIRNSLNLDQILDTTVGEVRQWLNCDRVLIYRFNPDWSGLVMVESVNNAAWSIMGRVIADPCFQQSWLEPYRHGRVASIEDIYAKDLTPCYVEFLKQYQIRANLVVPILLSLDGAYKPRSAFGWEDSLPKRDRPNSFGGQRLEQSNATSSIPRLWGLLIAHECDQPRKWQQTEIDFLQQLATHVAIAIQQSMLFEQLQQSRVDLEQRVSDRTAELETANRQLQQLNQELTRSNHDLQQFAYIASHDLREPLRMVTSFTQLLAKRYSGQLDAEADQIIHFAVDGAERMEVLIEGLLAYCRLGSPTETFKLIDCEAVLDQALSNLQLAIAETNAQISRIPLPTVIGDASQLTQLFQNLIANSIKYRGEATPIIEIGARKQEQEYLFWVKDNGIGINSQYSDRIFQIFQRLHTKQEYPGTGIGLAICHKIVEHHDGRIWVESEIPPGKATSRSSDRWSNLQQGATFYFTLRNKKALIP
jgi:light-regulated signal transduction histidine kinase (bacteriophytochrome)